MTSVESYLVVIVFIAVAAFSCGNAMATLDLKTKGELGKEPSTSLTLLGIAAVPVTFVYGVKWGILIDGPHFVWVPALIVWLIAFSHGRKWAISDSNSLEPYRVPAIGASAVVAGYYLLYEFTTK